MPTYRKGDTTVQTTNPTEGVKLKASGFREVTERAEPAPEPQAEQKPAKPRKSRK